MNKLNNGLSWLCKLTVFFLRHHLKAKSKQIFADTFSAFIFTLFEKKCRLTGGQFSYFMVLLLHFICLVTPVIYKFVQRYKYVPLVLSR